MAIESIEKLTTQLARLPGIGRKTAQRLAYHLLRVQKEQATELAEAILSAREKVHPCPICGAFFMISMPMIIRHITNART